MMKTILAITALAFFVTGCIADASITAGARSVYHPPPSLANDTCARAQNAYCGEYLYECASGKEYGCVTGYIKEQPDQ